MSTVRPILSQRGKTTANKRTPKKKRHLRAVNPANERKRKGNPEEQAIPWKTIVATTVVTSIVSTFAVTFARFLLERARARKELKALGLGQQAQQQALPPAQAPMAANPGPMAVHGPPQFQLPAPNQPRTIPIVAQPFGAPTPGFEANPFAPSNVQRPMAALPSAPHVDDSGSEPPAWFRAFQEDYERRMDAVENGGRR